MKKTLPQIVRRVVVAVAALAVATSIAVPNAAAVGAPQQEQSTHAQMIAGILDEHNKIRRTHDLPEFMFSPDISLRVTQPFTNTMAVKNNGTIWHNTATNIGKGGSVWAENVAGGYKTETAEQLVQRWMNSSGHRTNILNANYTTIAIGFAYPDTGTWTFSTVNFYQRPAAPGATYKTGALWLQSRSGNGGGSQVNVYINPGYHLSGGREWNTRCEPYSSTVERCWTQIKSGSGQWVHNNLTYKPSPRAQWKGNPLGGNGVVGYNQQWKSADGKLWRTECDTPATGRNGCRVYINSGGEWVFNNIIMFS